MKQKLKYTLLALAMGCILATACIHQGNLVGVPATLMQYQHKPTEAKLLALAKSYAEAINQNLEQQAPCPGQYADYGIALAKLGCFEQANIMFNNEKMLFPNSSLYIDMLKQTLTPLQSADNHFDTSRIDLHTLDTIPITYTPEEEALRRQQADDPEFKRMLKEQAKEERERQAEAKRKAKKAETEAREARRQAEREALQAQRQAEKEAREAQRQAEKEARQAQKALQDSISRAQKQTINK